MIARCLIVFLLLVGQAFAEGEITIGVPVEQIGKNYLYDSAPFAQFVRWGAFPGLTVPGTEKKNELAIATSYTVTADLKMWSFLLRPSAEFENDEPITGVDVVSSLERCKVSNLLSSIVAVKLRIVKAPQSVATMVAPQAEWVDVVIDEQKTEVKTFASTIGLCPIISHRSQEVFGEELGIGTNGIGGGPYVITRFKPERELTMMRFASDSKEESDELKTVTFSAYETSLKAVTALRTGNYDAFVATNGAELKTQVGEDPTIELKQCADWTLAVRKGLLLGCPYEGQLKEVRYKWTS